jgi:hypothetical protein
MEKENFKIGSIYRLKSDYEYFKQGQKFKYYYPHENIKSSGIFKTIDFEEMQKVFIPYKEMELCKKSTRKEKFKKIKYTWKKNTLK